MVDPVNKGFKAGSVAMASNVAISEKWFVDKWMILGQLIDIRMPCNDALTRLHLRHETPWVASAAWPCGRCQRYINSTACTTKYVFTYHRLLLLPRHVGDGGTLLITLFILHVIVIHAAWYHLHAAHAQMLCLVYVATTAAEWPPMAGAMPTVACHKRLWPACASVAAVA